MKTSLDFEVILDSSSGTVGGSGNSYSRDLFSKDDPHKADDNGEFTIPVEGKPKGFIKPKVNCDKWESKIPNKGQ